MALGLIGKKIGMTQIFDESGTLIPVTVIQAGPCYVTQKRVIEKDGYQAVRIAFDEKAERKLTRPELGLYKKAGVPACSIEREFRGSDTQECEVGQALNVELFAAGERVDVIGSSKGRGFTGVYKRHKSRPGPKSHGSMYHNRPGSNGASSDPSRTYKGKPNPGHMGNARVTVSNLEIVRTLPEKNLILVRGSVPGHNNAYVMIRRRVAAGNN